MFGHWKRSIVGGGSKPPRSAAEEGDANRSGAAVTLLVIQSDNYDWPAIFAGYDRLSDGRPIRVVQTGWEDILVQADSPAMSPHTSCLVHCRGLEGKQQSQTIRPDFVLLRNEVRGAVHTQDYRNALYGLMFAGVPSVNSLQSVYSFLERPIVQAELHKIQRQRGVDHFPVIPQSYYASFSAMMYGSRFPAVLKIGHAHAGAGKMKVADHHDFEDVRSVVAMTDGKYCTVEPFVEGDFDVRIQKIGQHYRSYRRTDISGNWKTNAGCSVIDEIETSEKYKLWVDEASQMFGGLDICTVDVIVERETAKEYILEVNGTSSGLSPDRAAEDNGYIRDLVLERMNKELTAAS